MQRDRFLPVLPCHPWARHLLQSQGKVSWGPTSASPSAVSPSSASDRHIVYLQITVAETLAVQAATLGILHRQREKRNMRRWDATHLSYLSWLFL